jgi:FkbM family methyltransferase
MVVSYAQNCEDVMLRRALGHIPNGVYIDVGAWSPDTDSVTRMFYDAGWSGVNIEPLPSMLAQLQTKRPRDVNLGVALSDTVGTAQFFNIADTGLSTLDRTNALRGRSRLGGGTVFDVEITTLARIWDAHVPPDQPVHFLKIDVEGLEEKVIRGADWVRHRPWVLVIEAVLPQDPTENHHPWDPLLRAAGYEFVWHDGLNRFYIAAEHPELRQSFQTPPNVFDDFKLARVVEMERALAAAENRVQDMQAQLAGTPRPVRRLFAKAGRHLSARFRSQLHRILPRKLVKLIGVPASADVMALRLSPDAVRKARRIAATRSRLSKE